MTARHDHDADAPLATSLDAANRAANAVRDGKASNPQRLVREGTRSYWVDADAPPPAEGERLTAAGIRGFVDPTDDETDRELAALYSARDELAELRERVRGVAERYEQMADQARSASRAKAKAIEYGEERGKWFAFELVAADLLAIIEPGAERRKDG